MEKKLIHFDQQKFESKKIAFQNYSNLINEFVGKFNSMAGKTEFAIEVIDDIQFALGNLQQYILKRIKENFQIGSKTLTKDKAFEMGLIENPDWFGKAQGLCESTKDQIKQLYAGLDSNPFLWLVYQSGTITLNQDKISDLQESCSYYLNESKREDYEAVTKLIELSKKSLPDMVAGNFNGFSIVEKYIQLTCRNLPVGNGFAISPDPDFFSKD